MSKHTPGPWRIGTRVTGNHWAQHQVFVGCGPESERPYPLARIYAKPNQTANARLIAAAPDLLEACKVVALQSDCVCRDSRSHDHGCDCAGDIIRAAIQKAEGDE